MQFLDVLNNSLKVWNFIPVKFQSPSINFYDASKMYEEHSFVIKI